MGKENNFLKKINENLDATLGGGIIIGAFGVFGYGGFIGYKLGWYFVFLSFLLASACYMSGFFLGILFGIPKRQNNDSKSDYLLNNNLADISDWLTKIIIGLGLIELKNIPTYLSSAGDYIMNSVDSKESSLKLFAICCIVYFTVFGLYYGYCYMRLYLSGQIKKADNDLLENSAQGQEAKMVEALPTDEGGTIDKDAKKLNEQLKISKKEEDYSSEDWYYKGIDFYNKKEYEKTIAAMEKAFSVKAKTRNAEANIYLYIGLSQTQLGFNEKGIEQFDKIINNYSDYDKLYLIHHNKGIALSNLKRYTEALTSSNKSIELKPDYAYAWTNKSLALSNLKLYNEAIEAINKAIEFKPDYAIAWNNKSSALVNLKRYDEALIAANKAIEFKPDYALAWVNKGLALSNLKLYDEALIAANKAIELKPNYAIAWNNKSLTLIYLKRYDEALNAANKSIEIKPDYDLGWNNKSLTLNNLKRYNEALDAANKGIELNPTLSNLFYIRAKIYAGLNNKDNTISNLKRAIELDLKWKENAKTDGSFKNYWEDADFKKLVE